MNAQKTKGFYNKISSVYDLAHHIQTLWADTVHRRAVIHYADIKPGEQVLDIGTGTGITACMAAQKHNLSSIMGIDFAEDQIRYATQKKVKKDLYNVVFMCEDAIDLPFRDNHFDSIISAYGLGGIEEIDKAMEEIRRVGKPNAKLVFAEMSDTPKMYPFRRRVHKKLVEPWIKYKWHFRDLDLPHLLEKHGFIMEYKKFFNNYFLGSTTLVKGKIIK